MKLKIFLIFFCFCVVTQAIEPRYHFMVANGELRFKRLTEELRCLVCQNENLAQSQAPLANDLRKDIVIQINQGKSDQQIKDFLVNRYGEFVLYHPAFEPTTYLLWLFPLILIIIGFVVLKRVTNDRSD